MVSLPHTVSQPRAVVIEPSHTATTSVAVLGSQWLLESTYSAVTATWLRLITWVFLLRQDKLNVITAHWSLARLLEERL